MPAGISRAAAPPTPRVYQSVLRIAGIKALGDNQVFLPIDDAACAGLRIRGAAVPAGSNPAAGCALQAAAGKGACISWAKPTGRSDGDAQSS